MREFTTYMSFEGLIYCGNCHSYLRHPETEYCSFCDDDQNESWPEGDEYTLDQISKRVQKEREEII